MTIFAEVRGAIAALAPGLAIYRAGAMRDALGGMRGFLVFELGASLAAVLGLLGLALAVVGIYGVVSCAAGQRRREIGIRLALGAERAAIVRTMLGRGLLMVGQGLAAGLVAAAALARLVAGLLVGVGPADLPTYAVVTVALAGVALAACYLPARQGTRVDAAEVLRCDAS